MTSSRLGSPSSVRRIVSFLRRAETQVALAFGTAIVLLLLGGYDVWQGGRRHRATADETLRDHASYIAGMIASAAGNQGWFATRITLNAWNEALMRPQPWPARDSILARALRDAVDPGLARFQGVRFFAGDSSGWRSPEGPLRRDDPIMRAVQQRAAGEPPHAGTFHTIVVPMGRDTSLAFLAELEPGASAGRWYGFDLPLEEYRTKVFLPRIQGLSYSFVTLRDSLRKARGGEEFDTMPPISVRISTHDGTLLYQTAKAPHPPWMGMRMLPASTPGHVEVSVEPSAVPVLMPGGYPPDPAQRVLVALSVGLLLLGSAAVLAYRTLALTRQRDEFTSSISHELRTPLTNIQLFAETLLMERARTEDERHAALETITRETRRLVHMVENALAFSRVGRPSLTLVRRAERVERLVHDAVASFAPLFRAHDIEPAVAVSGPPVAEVDGDAVRRILVNLLDNAVRYGPRGQTLRIGAMHHGDRLELAVEDEGPGIPPGDRARVWKAFERGIDGLDGGTGIGLAVVAQLVTLHGGKASIEDGRRGARFVVVLPLPPRPTGVVA